jgi:hypothetical protein
MIGALNRFLSVWGSDDNVLNITGGPATTSVSNLGEDNCFNVNGTGLAAGMPHPPSLCRLG